MEGIRAAIRDSLKLKYPEVSSPCCGLFAPIPPIGVKPVLVVELCELFDKFRTGEFLMGD